MSMDIQQLTTDEQNAYFSIIEGNSVKIIGKNKEAIVQMTSDDKKYEVYDPHTAKVSKPLKYPIDAFFYACKIVGGFSNWSEIL